MPSKLETWITHHKGPAAAGGIGVALGLFALVKRRSSGAAAPAADATTAAAPATSSQAAIPGYDSSATDVYNAITPQLQGLSQQIAAAGLGAGPTGTATGTGATTGAGQTTAPTGQTAATGSDWWTQLVSALTQAPTTTGTAAGGAGATASSDPGAQLYSQWWATGGQAQTDAVFGPTPAGQENWGQLAADYLGPSATRAQVETESKRMQANNAALAKSNPFWVPRGTSVAP